ncbi:MAG: apolipoprotein N-acyltransferase [Burkholderiaceae bacterium]
MLAGAAHAVGFALPGGGWLQTLSLAAMLTIWLVRPAAAGWRRSATIGLAFGLGWFTCGLYWLYISMHDFGGMPAPLAGLALLLFAAYLSLFPAAVLVVVDRLRRFARADERPAPASASSSASSSSASSSASSSTSPATPASARSLPGLAIAAAFGACWLLAEWLRGTLFTGFPWLAIGYAHVDSPLAGWAPVLGVLGVDGMAAMLACGLALLARRRPPRIDWPVLIGAVVLPLAIGQGLRAAAWTEPEGAPIPVRLVQGNVPQSMKFDSRHTLQAMRTYLALIDQPPAADPPVLTVLPETAWTVPWPGTPPEIVDAMFAPGDARRGVIAIGMPMTPHERSLRDARAYGDDPMRVDIANSVVLLDRADPRQPIAQYDKHHLVPFGEFVPIGFQWFVHLMNIPLGSFTRGAIDQPPIAIDGQRVAFNICYEDLFGQELLPAVRQGASILINASNLGWFGDSVALPQHLAIARMRAIETGRPMLRATNTGVTASIDAGGRVRARLASDAIGALDDSVQGMRGLTPYARLGDTPALLLALVVLAIAAFARAARGRPSAAIR